MTASSPGCLIGEQAGHPVVDDPLRDAFGWEAFDGLTSGDEASRIRVSCLFRPLLGFAARDFAMRLPRLDKQRVDGFRRRLRHRISSQAFWLCVGVVAVSAYSRAESADSTHPPNIVVILADDKA